MCNPKTVIVLLMLVAACCGDSRVDHHDDKHHHHHCGLHHYHFFYYMAFLAIKLKVLFFLGTIFTISMVAGKVIGIIKLTEYMKNKYHHEEKVVYVDHGHHDYGGYQEGHAKNYESYPPDFPMENPPTDAYKERYGSAPKSGQFIKNRGSGRSSEDGGFFSRIYSQLLRLPKQLRQLNVTEMTLNEMGIKDEHCKKKFICKADFNAKRNLILRTGMNFFRDVSYERYKTNSAVTSERECDTLYKECKEPPS